jgi:TATA-binding protein-associated factor
MEPHYNPVVDLQAIHRLHRLGQNRSVTIFRMVTKGTLEEWILELQRFKTFLSQSVLQVEPSTMTNVQEGKTLAAWSVISDERDPSPWDREEWSTWQDMVQHTSAHGP